MDYHRVIHALERPYGDAKRYSECTCTDEMWGIVLAYAFQTCILLHLKRIKERDRYLASYLVAKY